MQYEYLFDRIELEIQLPLRLVARDDYHELIDLRAREGWRLVQVFAPSVFVLGGGIPDWFELIFERPVASGVSPSGAA
jgi:hypothetical protein